MKDLITRKNITQAALKNTRKKHAVEMNELFAKIEFLKDEDILLNQKIQEKEQELLSMEKKFSEKKGDNRRMDRNVILHFNSWITLLNYIFPFTQFSHVWWFILGLDIWSSRNSQSKD